MARRPKSNLEKRKNAPSTLDGFFGKQLKKLKPNTPKKKESTPRKLRSSSKKKIGKKKGQVVFGGNGQLQLQYREFFKKKFTREIAELIFPRDSGLVSGIFDLFKTTIGEDICDSVSDEFLWNTFNFVLKRGSSLNNSIEWASKYRPCMLNEGKFSDSLEELQSWMDMFKTRNESIRGEDDDSTSLTHGRAYIKRYFQSGPLKTFPIPEKLPQKKKNYIALLLSGPSGIGKTTLLECYCASNNIELEVIDCFQFEKFSDLKKKYEKAVKIEVNHTYNFSNQGNILNFFRSPNKLLEEIYLTPQKSKMFLLQNLDHLLDQELMDIPLHPESTQEFTCDFKSIGVDEKSKALSPMVNFFRYSNYPFVIECDGRFKSKVDENDLPFDEIKMKKLDDYYVEALVKSILCIEKLVDRFEIRRFQNGQKTENLESQNLAVAKIEELLKMEEDCKENTIEYLHISLNDEFFKKLLFYTRGDLNKILSRIQFHIFKRNNTKGLLEDLVITGPRQFEEDTTFSSPDIDLYKLGGNIRIKNHLIDCTTKKDSLLDYVRAADLWGRLRSVSCQNIKSEIISSNCSLLRTSDLKEKTRMNVASTKRRELALYRELENSLWMNEKILFHTKYLTDMEFWTLIFAQKKIMIKANTSRTRTISQRLANKRKCEKKISMLEKLFTDYNINKRDIEKFFKYIEHQEQKIIEQEE